MAEPSSRSAPFLASSGARLLGRYTLLGKLGAGGQGEVWRARGHLLGNEIALKILRPALAQSEDAWAALEHEHAIASRLDHPLILKGFAPERDAEVAALPMEFAPGGDLRRLRGATYLEIVPVLMEVVQALAHAHVRGVVHRDLKPGNVLFDARGHVRLADFGIAGMVLDSGAAAAGSRIGVSPFTASPEQLRGEPPSPADDIYGLGALAYELLSGYPPYYPRFELARVLVEPVPPLKPMHPAPDQLIELVMAMLAKRGAERPRSMLEVGELLEATLNDTLTLTFEGPGSMAEPFGSPPTLPLSVVLRAVPTVAPTRPLEPVRLAEPIQPAVPVAFLEPVELVEPVGRVEPRQLAEAARASEVVAPDEPPVPPAAAPDADPAKPTPEQDRAALWNEVRHARAANPADVEPARRSRWPWIVVIAIALAAVVSSIWLPRWAPELSQWTPPPLELPRWVAPSSVTNLLASVDQWMGHDAATPAGVPRAALSPVRTVQPPAATLSPTATAAIAPQATALPATAQPGAPIDRAPRLNADSAAPQPGELALPRGWRKRAWRLDTRLTALRARGADDWAGASYSAADKSLREAREAGAAGDAEAVVEQLTRGERLADALDESASRAAASALASGEQALAAGDGAAARAAFANAARIDPGEMQADAGLVRASPALRARAFAELRTRAAALEAENRFGEALEAYDAALSLDPSLSFAQQGRAHAELRAQLRSRLQALINDPRPLASAAARGQAAHLIAQANAASADAPLRALAARLASLLPQYHKPAGTP